MRRPWFLCALAAVTLYSCPYFGQLKSANELPRIFLTTEMVDRGTFAIDARLPELGSRFDVSRTPDGRHFSNKAPGLSLLAVPAYLAVKGWHAVAGGTPSLRELTWAFRLSAVAVPALAFLPVFWAVARRFAPGAPRAADTALAAYALGSLALPYSILFYSHQVAAALCGASFACAIALARTPDLRRPGRWAAATGALAGLAVLVDYQAAIAGLAVGLYLLARAPRRWRHAALALAGAAPAAAALAAYHTACFGAPWRTGYAFAPDPAHARGVLGIVGPNARAMANALVAPDNGLLWLSPWVALAVAGAVAIARDGAARRRVGAEAAVCAAVVAAYVLFLGSTVPEFGRGGWSVGPRYIAAAIPFAGWLAAAGLAAVDRRPAIATVALALVWIGVAVYVLAASTFPHWPWPNFTNPLRSVSMRLVAEGMAPYSAGTLLGLRGIAAYLPAFAGAAAVTAALTAGRDRHRWRRTAIAAALAAAALVGYARVPERGPGADRGWRYIERIWEPR